MSNGLTPVNRKLIRQEIATSLSAALTSSLVVYPFLKGGFEGDSPVVRIMSAGTERTVVGDGVGYESKLYFDIQLMVLNYVDGSEADEIAEAAANTLDDLEYELFSWLADNQQIPHEGSVLWKFAGWEGRSRVQPFAIGTHFYLIETVPIVVEVMG